MDANQKIESRRFMQWPADVSAPMRVAGVCLPFIFVKRPEGEFITLDARQCRLAMLNKTYGRRAFTMLAAQAKAAKAKGDQGKSGDESAVDGE